MGPWVDAVERAGEGLRAATVPAEGKLPTRVERAMETYLATIAGSERPVIGGVSYGGRVASMVAAEGAALSGLVLLSYPLHPPGKTDQQRVDHLGNINCPVLFLSGQSDPFARMDLLQAAVSRLKQAELHTYAGVGHGLSRDSAVMADAVERIAAFSRRVLGLGGP
jgi:predicted alpha/beta-hydrolase family hydrolase